MKTTYFLFVLGLLCAVAYSFQIEEDEPLEDELLEGKRFEESIFNMVSYIAA
jgi:hypothetical protein